MSKTTESPTETPTQAELDALARAIRDTYLDDSDPYVVVLHHDTDGDNTAGLVTVSQDGRRYITIDSETAVTLRSLRSADPLQGYSPDEILVGPGGQTLAQAAEAEMTPGWEDRAVERARAADLFGAGLEGSCGDGGALLTMPPAQWDAALRLGHAHGHMWAAADPAAYPARLMTLATECERPEPRAAITRLRAALDAGSEIDVRDVEAVTIDKVDPQWIGISHPWLDGGGIHEHTTGSRRLRWIVERDGRTTLVVSRPDGDVLRAVIDPDEMRAGRRDGLAPVVERLSPSITLAYRHVRTMVDALSSLGLRWEPELDITSPALAKA
jgi:hypothetical protein